MRELFNAKQAAKIICKDMIEFNISFDKAWRNLNNEWFNNKLSEVDKNKTKSLIKM